MIVLYKNTNEDMELYYGELISSVEKLESAIYISIGENKSLRSGMHDWKKLHINEVYVSDIVALYENEKSLKIHRGQYFV